MACFIDILNVSITGDCSNTNSGGFSFELSPGGAPPYTISGISPVMSAVVLTGLTYEMTGMSGGGYSFIIQDSCLSGNVTTILNINISTGTCVSINSSDTTCGDNNGTITASTSSFYGTANYYVYETTLGYITSATTAISGPYVFDTSNSTLSAGTYYVIADDGGGCTGRSESCIIKSSTTLNWDFYVVNDAGCNEAGSGAVYIQNLDGVPPYQFTWSTGAITQNVSGLTAGFYNVTVTDSTGCQQNKSVQVLDVPSVGLGAFFVTNPSCFANDGEVLVTITGGTGPYYYQGSNGQTFITFSQTQLFTNVPAGFFTVLVTDAALCTFTEGVELVSPLGFSLTQIDVTNSYCNNQTGQIQVSVLSSAFPISYTLTDSLNNSTQLISNSQTQSFQNLSSDTYDLTISAGSCSLTTSVTVSNIPILELTYNVTGTTCDECNGAIELIVSGGSPNYWFTLSNGQTYSNIPFSSQTFTNLCAGSYKGTVLDPTPQRCSVSENIFVPSSSNVYFQLFATQPSAYANNGTIQTLITQGTAPFSLNWSSNVNGQTGLTINNLSAGTYTLTVTDADGCVYKQSVVLTGFVPLQSYQLYNICDSDFINNGLLLTKGVKQMLLEGFYDLTSGDTNCILDESYFTAIVTVGDITKTNTFYTGYTLNDYPSNQQWANVTEDMLLTFDGITGVTTNVEDNQIKITTPCDTLDNALVKVDLLINYVVSCQFIEPPVPCTCYALVDMGGLPGAQEVTFTNCYTSEEQTIQFAGIDGLPSKFPYFCSQTKPIRYDGLTANTFYISASTCDNCCRCYIMSGNSTGIDPTGTTYQYLDCNGVSNVVDLAPGEELSVCASVIPWRLSTDNIGNIYSNSGSGGANYFPLCTGSPPTCPT